jgi:hypothetical protein
LKSWKGEVDTFSIGVLRHIGINGQINARGAWNSFGISNRGTQGVVKKIGTVQLIDRFPKIITGSKVNRGRKVGIGTRFGIFGVVPAHIKNSRF